MADASKALMETITELNGSAEHIIFWTNYQRSLLAGDHKHLKLGFKYGTGTSFHRHCEFSQAFILTGKTVIMIEMARKLADSGQKVTYLLCYDTFDLAKKEHVEIKKEDHFLFQTLQERFKDSKVQLEFVSVRNVICRVNELIASAYNVFVDEFSFEYTKFDSQVRKEVMSCSAMLSLPSVSVLDKK